MTEKKVTREKFKEKELELERIREREEKLQEDAMATNLLVVYAQYVAQTKKAS